MGGRFIQRKFPNELLHCLSLSDSYFTFPFPSSACGNNTFFVYKILICNVNLLISPESFRHTHRKTVSGDLNSALSFLIDNIQVDKTEQDTSA